MASSILWFLDNTLTNEIRFFCNSFTSPTKISTDSSSYIKFGLTSIVYEETTCDGSDLYLLSIDTWKTLWIFSNSGGKANLYAIGPTFSITSYGPMSLGLNLPFSQISLLSSKAILSKYSRRSHIKYPFFSCRRRIFVYLWKLSIFL